MKVKEIMTKEPVVCTTDAPLREVAKQMVDCDGGAIPVVETDNEQTLAGIITDRDIVCRAVARNGDLDRTTAGECMSEPVASVNPDDSVEDCATVMARLQVRRLPVIDRDRRCHGLVTQRQVVQHLAKSQAGELVQAIAERTGHPSRVPTSVRVTR